MKTLLLMLMMTVSRCEDLHIAAGTGQNVTLICKYDAQYHGALSFCWGRGWIPNSGCGQQPIYNSGQKVEPGTSSRYQLVGQQQNGDVSMMILNVTEEDSGLYGCRIEIVGWFNDEKYQFYLKVEAPGMTTPPTKRTPTEKPPTESTAANQSSGHMTSTDIQMTSISNMDRLDGTKNERSVLMVCLLVLFLSMLLISSGGLFILYRRKRSVKVSQQIRYRLSFLTSNRTGSMVENIYQINEDTDDGLYERCP